MMLEMSCCQKNNFNHLIAALPPPLCNYANNTARKEPNLHAKPTAPTPQTPGATQHERGQTFMRNQIRQRLKPRRSNAARKRSNHHAKPTSPTPQPQSNAARKGSSLHTKPRSPTPHPPKQQSTKGVKPSCETNFAHTPTPGATQPDLSARIGVMLLLGGAGALSFKQPNLSARIGVKSYWEVLSSF